MTSCENLTIAYDYDAWQGYFAKIPITIDASIKNNSHSLICGMSGSGKSYYINQYLARICLSERKSSNNSEVYFADFKQDDSFAYLRKCPRYFPYDKTTEALDIVYEILRKRQSGEDSSHHMVTLCWDEYVANVLALLGTEKKKAEAVMRKVSELLMLGRSLGVRLVVSTQRPDAAAFPTGSRLNFGVIIILGSPLESIYSMLMPKELIDRVGKREFHTGEGIMLWQGADLHFIKVPIIQDTERMKDICIDALTR